jgi:hypothetical protein
MGVPPKQNPRWTELVTGKKEFTLKFLAAKIKLSRLIRNVQNDPSPATISAAVDEMHAIYTQNAEKSSAQEDLKTIFS